MVWTLLIGLVTGLSVKLISPGANKLSGFVITSILGILGAVGINQLGRAMGFYRDGEGAGLLAAFLGAIVVLLACWGSYSKRSGTQD